MNGNTTTVKGRICADCGTQLSGSAKFCRNCGGSNIKDIEPKKAADFSAARICADCGTQLSENAKFCRNCGGSNIKSSAQIAQAASPAPVKAPATAVRVCGDCGTQLSENAKFCRNCGGSNIKGYAQTAQAASPAPVKAKVAAVRVCAACGAQLGENAKFCRNCGGSNITVTASDTPAQKRAPSKSIEIIDKARQRVTEQIRGTAQRSARSAVSSIIENNVSAPSSSGEVLLGASSGVAKAIGGAIPTELVQQLNPIRTLISGGLSALKGILSAIKNPKALLTALLAAAVWLVVSLLPALGVEMPSWLCWLTAAKCGTTGGVFGIVGGALGKGVLLSAIIAAVQMVKDKEKLKLPKLNGIKDSIGMILIGVGLALVFANFITGDNSIVNSMASLAACFASYRALSTGGSFLSELLNSCVTWLKDKLPRFAPVDTDGIKTGLSVGFALSVPLSTIGEPAAGYLLGVVICAAGIAVCAATGFLKKEART